MERGEFLPMLAHELRSPISAIIGYQDLISEGLLGQMDPRIADALQRVRASADQLLALVASLGEADSDIENLHVGIDDENPRDIMDAALAAVAVDAEGRSTTLVVGRMPGIDVFRTDRERIDRALLLALSAAIRNTAGAELRFDCDLDDAGFRCTVRGARFQHSAQAIPNQALGADNAASLRLAMAAQAIRPLRGTISLEPQDGTSILTIAVPHAPESD